MKGKLLILHALTPVHVGTGQSVDVIDLPVARERATGWPMLPGSGLKGVLRDACVPEENVPAHVIAAFGRKSEGEDNGSAGELLFTDGHLLCLPVRSFAGVFAWVTCPAVLARLKRDCLAAGISGAPQNWPNVPNMGDVAVTRTPPSALVLGDTHIVYLEDLDLTPVTEQPADTVAAALAALLFSDQNERDAFLPRLAIVSDDLFTFLAETATEVVARIAIADDTKTVKRGALWYEEAMPAETLFWSVVFAEPRGSRTKENLFSAVGADPRYLQIGGNASVGRGLVRARLVE
jgi:CRISPR-associated protein Cmr4